MERTEQSKQFEEYWRSIRPNENDLPDKSAINPVELKSLLGWIAFTEVDPDEHRMLVTMIGQSIRELVGFNLQGLDFNELDHQPDPAEARRRHLAYHSHPFGRVEELDIQFGPEISTMCELTLLPVWGEGQKRVLFCLLQPLAREKAAFVERKGYLTQGATKSVNIDLGNGLPDL